MSLDHQKDDALFEQLSRNKKRRRRRIWITVLTIIAVVAVLFIGSVLWSEVRYHQKQKRRMKK